MNHALITVSKASQWASDYLDKPVTASNISYLIQYAKVRKFFDSDRKVCVDREELKKYYDENIIKKDRKWKKSLGKDLNWNLSFSHLKEFETTKHVHRLHPYKGKFIPQLVEYFLNGNLNSYKKQIFFKKGDTVLDPFMGSGTTLIQAKELGLNSIGIDVSDFNCLISKVKLDDYDSNELEKISTLMLKDTLKFSNLAFDNSFDEKLKEKLNEFNARNFPVPNFKFKVQRQMVSETEYGWQKLKQFLTENKDSLRKNRTKNKVQLVNEKEMNSFLSKWFSKRVKQELFHCIEFLDNVKNEKVKNVLKIIISRTARSCRATQHSNLATLREPQKGPYYCGKHKKLCTPINSTSKFLRRYAIDTIKRIKEYSALKQKTHLEIIQGDSRKVNVLNQIKSTNKPFHNALKKNKIDGVFTSPPYVGQIDYHEQHAYAYELFEVKRKDHLEIGPLSKGKSQKARDDYVRGISGALSNVSKFVKQDGNFFIVANDKFNLYPTIAKKSGLEIVDQFKRPVLNRTERDTHPYSEIIFHMKKV